MISEIVIRPLGYFRSGDPVKINIDGEQYLGVIKPCDARGFGGGYRGSDEVNVRCEKKIPGSNYAGGHGVIAAVCSPDIEKA